MNMQADLYYNAPAALGESPRYDRVGDNYSFLSTREVVDALVQDHWVVVDAQQTQVKNPEARPYAKHRLTLVAREAMNRSLTEIPRLILSNSHDGNAKFWLRAGLWRYICSNGLEISDGLIQAVGIRHSRRTTEEVVTAAQAFRANADKILEHIAHFKATELSPAAACEFVRQAIALRQGDSESVVAIEDILRPQRSEDAGNDLWRVFNRAQEWLLKGGYPVYHRTTNDWAVQDARPIKAIDTSSKLNTGLWQLAETFSKN